MRASAVLVLAACGAPAGPIDDDASIDASGTPCAPIAATPHVRLCSVTRTGQGPLISPATHPNISSNITMPSVLRAPDALATEAGLGRYWMYFAAHDGHYIRLATADALAGPWTTYAAGTLKDTEVAPFSNTISSPDVFVLPSGRVRMYFSTDSYPGSTEQWTGVAESDDGIHFALASTQNIAKYYLRVFAWNSVVCGLAKGWSTAPAELGASPDGIARFAPIKTMNGGSIRHMAVLRDGNTLLVFYSVIGDAPERILLHDPSRCERVVGVGAIPADRGAAPGARLRRRAASDRTVGERPRHEREPAARSVRVPGQRDDVPVLRHRRRVGHRARAAAVRADLELAVAAQQPGLMRVCPPRS
jgi:hypothetical protein